MVATFEPVVPAGPAKGGGPADRGVAAFDSMSLAGAIAEALINGGLREDAILAGPTWRAVGDTAAAVGKPSWRSAFVVGAGIGRLAALTVHANLLADAPIATAGVAVDARRAYALVLSAHESITQAVATEHGFRPLAATGWDDTALGPAREVGACVLLASANEILTVRAANAAFGAPPALDRTVAPVRQRAALDRNA